MKTIIISSCVFLMLISLSCEKKVDILKEEKAISELLEKYYNAWENHDLDTILSSISHEPYSSIILLYNRSVFGWDSLKVYLTKEIQRFKQQQDFYYHSEILDLKTYVNGNVAYSTFKVKVKCREDGKDYFGIINKVFYVFEKKNAVWKILFAGFSESDFGENEN